MDDSRSAPAHFPRIPANSLGPDPLVGRVINDRYRIVGIIARGGMGKVYRAEQQPLGRLVALKVLNPNYTGDNDPEFHKRFFLEASIASKLTHPNTVTIFDYGKTDDDVYYIAMELLEGRTLHRTLREEAPLGPERTMHIGRQICRSLREAHGLGVIHRDLKPANVYLVEHGDESDCVKVLDFGLVKNLESGEELTQAGLFMGSPKYMAPEQIRGERVDARVDVYALGVMMFEMLTGRVPFDRQNSVNILMAHIQEDVPPMSAMNPSVRVPASLEAVVRKCMAKAADDRYASMEEVLRALKECAGLNMTLSGELRLGDLADLSRSVELPVAPPQVRVRGELLSGGKPSITTLDNNFNTLITGTPTYGQLLTTNLGSVAANDSRPRSRTPLIAAAAAAVFVLAGVAWKSATGTASSAANAGVQASAPRPEATPLQPVPTVTQLPSTTVSPTHTLLVSLRSTPPGAMVIVGDKEFGPTPTQVEWTGEEAKVGREVTFVFTRKGYRDLTVTRQIRGSTLEVDAPPMDPVGASAPAPVRRAPTTAAGTTPTPTPKPDTSMMPLRGGYKAEPY